MPNRTAPKLETASHPIQVVARRTGLSQDVIRAWEKRYAVVTPVRTATGRRLYSDSDIERLRLLARATLAGRSIGQLAALPLFELAALFTSETPAPERPAAVELTPFLEAVDSLDGPALDALLRRSVVALSAQTFLDDLVSPLNERLNDRVRAGSLRPFQRHVAIGVLRLALYRMIEVAASPLAAPHVLIINQSGRDELSALMISAAAAAEGWRVTYLGTGLAAAEIAEAAIHTGAQVVLLSVSGVPNDRVLPRELRELAAALPREIEVWLEGVGADANRNVVREIGATCLRDLAGLRASLRAHRFAVHPAGRN